jgi:collagenase-like PrtC family protease
MELTLGPVLFDWKRSELLRFYEEAADMAVDRVYVGEVVCVKKSGLGPDDLTGVVERLERAGKKVTLSGLAVVSNEEELDAVRRTLGLCGSIEANDVSVLNMADASRKEVFAGPHITTYNAESVGFLKGIGVARVTLPVELPRETVAPIIERYRDRSTIETT